MNIYIYICRRAGNLFLRGWSWRLIDSSLGGNLGGWIIREFFLEYLSKKKENLSFEHFEAFRRNF